MKFTLLFMRMNNNREEFKIPFSNSIAYKVPILFNPTQNHHLNSLEALGY